MIIFSSGMSMSIVRGSSPGNFVLNTYEFRLGLPIMAIRVEEFFFYFCRTHNSNKLFSLVNEDFSVPGSTGFCR